MNKNILMLLPNGFDPDPRVHNEAMSLVDNGYNVTILCWDRDLKYQEKEIVDGINIERIFIRSSYGRGSSQIGYLWKFWKEAFQRAVDMKPDIIHAHDFNTLPLGYWIGRRLKIPVIFDAHESYHEMLIDNVHPLIKWTIAITERFLVKRIDLLITVGSILEDEYKRRGAKKTVVVGNWKRLDKFIFSEEEKAKVKEEIGIPEDKLIISYVGYFVPTRGLITLLEAVADDPEVVLVIGGKGTIESEISALASKAENILYLGYTKPDRVPLISVVSDVIYYCLADSSGNNKYSAPNKLFEALAAGKAIMTTSLGEIARIVKNDKCGVTLNKINKEELLGAFSEFRNKSVLDKYKENSLKAGRKKYNWGNAEKILLNAYRDITS